MTGSPRLLLALLIVAAVTPHLVALGNGFVFDDQGVIVENRAVTGFDWTSLWTGSYWPNSGSTNLYRPLTSTTYALDWAIGGGDPEAFVVTNLLLHLAATLAGLWLLRRLFPDRPGLAWAAAFLFAVHPIHVEAVVGIVGRAETLAALLILLSYRLWLDAEARGAIVRGLASALLWFLALLSKESAISLPVLLLAHRLGILAPSSPRRSIRAADLAWPVLFAATLLMRGAALGGLRAPRAPWIDNPLAHVGALERALGALGVLARQSIQIVTGSGYSADYSYAEVDPGRSLYLLGGAILAILAAGLFLLLSRGRRSPEGWGFGFFLALWLVTSNLLVPIGTVQADRLLYLPLLGLLVVAAGAFSRLPRRFAPPIVPLVLLTLIMIRCGIASGWQARQWRDNRSIFSAAVREAPRSVKARANLAAVLLRDGRPETARAVLELIRPVSGIGKEYGPLIQREAKARMFLGEEERARDLFRVSLQAGGDSAEALVELGNLAILAQDGDEALASFDLLSRTGKKADHVAIGRASALSLLGRYEESAGLWRPLVAALPDSVPVRVACAWNLREAGRVVEATGLLREGLARADDPRLWNALARALLAGGGSGGEALRTAARAVEREASDENRTTLALAQIAAGKFEEAVATRSRIGDQEALEEIDAALGRRGSTP